MADAVIDRKRGPSPLIIAVVLAHVAVLGWLAWFLTRPSSGHWAAVEQARRLMAQGQPDLALAAVSKIRDEAPGAAEAMSIAGQALLSRGDIVSARQALQRSLLLNPKQPEAAKMLAAIYLASGDGTRGLDLLRQAAELAPRDFRPWYAMGKVQLELGDFGAAAEAYGKALRLAPNAPEAREARIGRVRALLEASRTDEAAPELEVARRESPNDPRVPALAARLARATGDLDRAMEYANEALALNPREFDALSVRGLVHQLRGEREAALADLESAVEVNRNHPGTLQLIFQIRSQLGQTEEAERAREKLDRARVRLETMDALTKEITRNPEDPLPRYQMGELAVEGGLDALAYRCFQAALDLDPKFLRAREALEKLPPEAANPPAEPTRGR